MMGITYQTMIIIVYVLTYSKHNTRDTKKKKNCHTSLRLNKLTIEYYFFDYKYQISLNNIVLAAIQARDIIPSDILNINHGDTDNGCIYSTIHVVQQLMIMLLLMQAELFCKLFSFCGERTCNDIS